MLINGLFLAWVLKRWESEVFCDDGGIWPTEPTAPEHESSMGLVAGHPLRELFALSPSHTLKTSLWVD